MSVHHSSVACCRTYPVRSEGSSEGGGTRGGGGTMTGSPGNTDRGTARPDNATSWAGRTEGTGMGRLPISDAERTASG